MVESKHFTHTRTVGKRLAYEIEVRRREQDYVIRQGADLRKHGTAGAVAVMTVENILAVAVDDIENLVAMEE